MAYTIPLTNSDNYLSATYAGISPIAVHPMIQAAGVFEIFAGLLPASADRCVGRCGMARCDYRQSLLLAGYYELELRDFGFCLAAVALGRLAAEFD